MSAQEKTAGGLSRRNLWAYPVGTVGRDMAGCMFTNYLLTYVLFTKTLTSVQFACISVIMVAVRCDNRDRRRRANIRCAKRPDHGQHH